MSRSGAKHPAGQAMPRAQASKSRADKSRTVIVAPIPQVTVDIIPGRFTEDDWATMVNTEDGEEVVGDIVDSLISRVMEECYKVYLERQLIPYTICQARDAMIQMAEWTFIPRDEGEDQTFPERTWQEEPQPCPNDSWAQGCVPVTRPLLTPRPSQPQGSSKHLITDIPEQETEVKPQEEEVPTVPNTSQDEPPSSQNPNTREKDENQNELPTLQTTPLIIKPAPPPQPPKNKTKYRPYRGPLRSAGLKNLTKSLEDTAKEMFLEECAKERLENDLVEDIDLMPTSLHNILKIQLGRPPQKKDVIYDEAGNVLSMPKLDLSKLPQHHVRPRIEVLDSNKEAECQVKRPSHTSMSTPNQRGKRIKEKDKLSQDPRLQFRPSTFDSQKTLLHDKTLQAYTLTIPPQTDHTKDPVATNILLEAIQLSQGVILREGNTSERGSLLSLRRREMAQREDNRQLEPIRPSVMLPKLSVEQLIKNNIPQVHPITYFTPS
ncbi:uncharacterized protein C2orf81 homolog [Hyperolius riggenbachi]|uniref:uncharacterized protein C2orf81 homolog n=1 Tax=Hyperolius riggenbachi TaxID=752182 RepID=UPI0035A391BB